MTDFTIGDEDFLVDGKPLRILSGALHYFRVHPDQWRDRIRKARLMGLNTIETYVAWNAHAPQEDVFSLEGALDLGRFLDEVAAEGMYAIVRPGPYICAEWDNGGLPAWLFRADASGARAGVRRDEQRYLAAVERYLRQLAPVIVPRQIDRGGPVVLVQIENEYGAYGSDHAYLQKLVDMNRAIGLTVPFTTVDQPSGTMLEDGSLPSLHKTGSFGSRAEARLARLREAQPTGPLMCSEFWDGWFDFWGAHHHTTSTEDAAGELDALLGAGASVNVYMFHGGTNFGFTNGANDKGVYQPTVTSYDYDAPLDEAGNPTAKFWAFRDVIAAYAPVPDAAELAAAGLVEAGLADAGSTDAGLADAAGAVADRALAGAVADAEGAATASRVAAVAVLEEPVVDAAASFGPAGASVPSAFEVAVSDVVPLASALPALGTWASFEHLPTMDEIARYTGFALYRTTAPRGGVLELGEVRDRALVLLDGRTVGVLARDHHDRRIALPDGGVLEILVEDQGRVNYGHRIGEEKGLIGPALLGGEPLSSWEVLGLELDVVTGAALGAASAAVGAPVGGIAGPAFARFSVVLDEPRDLYLDTREWGKGVAWANGFNLGRYWSRGPQNTLFVPGSALNAGENEIVAFEIHAASGVARFAAEHDLGHTDF